MDAGQKTESLSQLVQDIDRGAVVLPEFQRDFVWDIEKTLDLFDSFVRDIFVGSLIYGVPSFEISARELDTRPRSGKGSRQKLQITSYSKTDIEKLVKTTGFRLLLDGQQRGTSIFRALKGIDPVYFVVTNESDLPQAVKEIPAAKRSLEQALSEFSTTPVAGHVSISLCHVFRMLMGEASREREKAELFLHSNPGINASADEVLASPDFEVFLTQAKNLENLLRQEKLVSYYLLDTDEEKFALFFERSNSKGIQLNFVDILAAKLYVGFNLRSAVETFQEETPSLPLNREAVVRAMSYVISGGKDTGRAYILSNLTHVHFTEHWSTFTRLYRRAYDYLATTRLLIHPAWMPYDNMIIPIIAFLRHIPHHDFAQISELQARVLQTWYWLAIFSRRYSSAAQTLVLEDSQFLEKVAKKDFGSVSTAFSKMQAQFTTPEDLFGVYKKYDSVYKGVLNLIHFAAGGLVSWQNGGLLSWESSLEDHHIFPKDYLAKQKAGLTSGSDSGVLTDCVVNRTLIPKLTNIKASNKPPSKYLGEIAIENRNLATALQIHRIPPELVKGGYDDLYDIFLEDRAKAILNDINTYVISARAALIEELRAKSSAV